MLPIKKYQKSQIFGFIVFYLFIIIMVFQLVVIENRRLSYYNTPLTSIANNPYNKIQCLPSFESMAYLRDKTPENSLVLTMQPSEMFYAHRKMVSYLSPSMITFYASKNINEAFNQLKLMGISYIHVPNYSLPPLSNSFLANILSDPNLAELVFFKEGFSIYKLFSNKLPKFLKNQSIANSNDLKWIKYLNYRIGGRQVNFSFVLHEELVSLPISIAPPSFPDSVVSLWSVNSNNHDEGFKVEGGKEYRLSLSLHGTSSLSINIIERDKNGNEIQRYQLDQINLKNKNIKHYSKRLNFNKNCRQVQVVIETKPRSELIIQKAHLIQMQ